MTRSGSITPQAASDRDGGTAASRMSATFGRDPDMAGTAQPPPPPAPRRQMTWWRQHRALVFLLGLAALAWGSFLGRVPLFDWDELNFAEVSREMLVLGDWSRVHINYELFWEKPPLFFWIQATSMKGLGVGAFAARFPNALIGLVNLVLLYVLGSRLEDRRLGWFWALAWFGSFLPHLYAKSGLIDPLFNTCMLLGTYGVLSASWHLEGRPRANTAPGSKAGSWRIWGGFAGGGVALGLAVLAKGPVGVLLPGLTVLVYLLLRPGRALWPMPRFWTGLALTGLMVLLTAGSWFMYDWMRNGPWFTESFLAYQWRLLRTEDAGHGGFPGYHPVVLMLGCFPASILAMAVLPRALGWSSGVQDNLFQNRRAHTWTLAMMAMLGVVLVVFGLVQSKIVHYSSLAYYPLTFLAAAQLRAWHRRGRTLRMRGVQAGLAGIASLWILALLAFFWASHNPSRVATLIDAPFAQAQWTLVPELPWWTLLPALVLPAMLWAGLHAWKYGQVQRGALLVFLGSALFLQGSLWAVIRPAETLAQGPVVAWWSALAGQDVYRYSAYRSYAPFFYGRPPLPQQEVLNSASERAAARMGIPEGKHGFYRRPESRREWLLWGPDLDKPVWVVARAGGQADYLATVPGMEQMKAHGGFVLLRRLPPKGP